MNDTWCKLYATVKTNEFQTIQDNLAKSTDLAIITVDYKGSPLTAHSECSKFCRQIRKLPEYAILCEKCDAYGGLEAAKTKEPFIYLCHANIIDVAVPIIVNDMYLGGIMAGQIRLAPNESKSKIEQIYRESNLEILFDLDPDLKKDYYDLPTISLNKIEATAKILETICKYMVQNPSEKLLDEIVNSVEVIHQNQEWTSSTNEILLKPAILYIDKNFSRKITLKQLAHACNISESYFSRLFAKCFGKNVTDYINDIRIEKAKVLLSNPDMTVNYISRFCGFEDSSYFIKRFKKFTGVTPQEFRKVLGGNEIHR
ncbi:MAG: PocR ligand-binding domain-containing protein [Clostridia bacterium]|nr:PocR ligand-binding domain-containing protein [Clostridia bacterium]